MSPLSIGLIGTGYAAQQRAAAIQRDDRAQLLMVASRTPQRARQFSEAHGIEAAESWQALISADRLDLILVTTVNALHGPIIRAALEAGKHVVVEYPLALDSQEAAPLLRLAAAQQRLLHVEHIELLGGLHQAMRAQLGQIGQPHWVDYRTLNPQRPAPQKWSYNLELSGFPLVAALSRVQRLTDLFGEVASVFCHNRLLSAEAAAAPYYGTCLCQAQLQFKSGLMASLTFGKGEQLWIASRRIEVQGSRGSLVFDRDQGILTTASGQFPIEVAPRRGLFVKDTQHVLDHLTLGTPLYVSPRQSLYSLQVADALRCSAATGQVISL
jgi:biliverdin reductase